MGDKLEQQEQRVKSLSIDILNMIKQRAVVEDLSPVEAICAITNVYMNGFHALKTEPAVLKDLFQTLLTAYSKDFDS